MIDYILSIENDDSPLAPDDNDEPCVFFVLADTRNFSASCPSGWTISSVQDEMNNEESEYTIVPLYAYIHSGIVLSLGKFSCPWDSGQIGYVVVQNGGADPNLIASAYVKEWNQYLSGDVYRFVVKSVQVCSLGHKHEEIVDSCGSFYDRKACEEEGEAVLLWHKNKYEGAAAK